MTHTRNNKGVCSTRTVVELSANGTIDSIAVDHGCDGNLKGLCALMVGMPATSAIERLQGITCDGRNNSCPHQISECLTEALEQLNQ